MQFGLNEIINLYNMNSRAMYERTFLCDSVYGDKTVDAEGSWKKFMGTYGEQLLKVPTHDNELQWRYKVASIEFLNNDENDTFIYKEEILKKALLQQLPFLKEMPKPPLEEIGNDYGSENGPTITNKAEFLGWLAEQENEFGAVHDIQCADEIIPVTDPSVIRLQEIRDNFSVYMMERGYTPEVLKNN